MKALCVLFAFCTNVVYGQVTKDTLDQKNLPIITFDTTVITKPHIVQHDDTAGIFVFHFKNTGNTDLIITAVHSSSGCLVPYYDKDPVKPGRTGTVIGHYDTNRLGLFTKTLTVYSNATKPVIVLVLNGKVYEQN